MDKKSGRRKSPSDFFKEDPSREHVLYKTGGREPVDVTKDNPYGPGSYWPDYEKIGKLHQGKRKPYIEIHNHPRTSEDFFIDENKKQDMFDYLSKLVPYQSSLPSFGDLLCMLRDDSIGSIRVYQHNSETNETEGAYVIRKTKRTPKSGVEFLKYGRGSENPDDASKKFAKDNEKLFDEVHFNGPVAEALRKFDSATREKQTGEERQRLYDELIKELHLQIKYVPAKGFSYVTGIGFLNESDRNRLNKKHRGLEGTLGIISIAGFLFSILFLSGITGNVIGTTETKNIFGLILIIIGLTTGGIYLYLKKKH